MWDRFLRAARREPVDTTPVWFMRQAGRYMAEYRAIRARYSLLEICKQPDLATEVTLQPLKVLEVDAAILFADILLPLEPMGAPFEFAAGEGPVIHEPVRDARGIARLKLIDPEEGLGYVLTAIRQLRGELEGKTPLIGFAGAPFTLASYLVEGGKSQNYATTKCLMYNSPSDWHELMGKLAEVVRRYLHAQIDAGAQAVQLFDSWVGALAPEDYREFIFPHVAHVLRSVQGRGVPVIHFGTGTATLLELQREAGGTVIGVDWRVPLGQAIDRMGPAVAIQGNLDPILLYANDDVLERRVRSVVEAGRKASGHIFNLGHGISPDMSVEKIQKVARWVHQAGQRQA